MISKFQLFAAALTGILACGVAGAQGRNGSSPAGLAGRTPEHAATPAKPPAASTAAPATVIPASRQTRVVQIPANGRIVSGFAEDGNSFNFDTSGSPGLGFDFPHLAAISGGSRRGSVHGGHRNRFDQGAFVPILFGGYPYYPYDMVYDQPEPQPVQQYQPQPQIIVIQQPAAAPQQVAGADSNAASARRDSSLPDAQVAPVRDVGDFILVRRDGRVVFASVFSVVGAQVQYVTPEGIRRTLAVSDIDSDATQQMNEARGTTVQIHN
jgi:hypothetical protein